MFLSNLHRICNYLDPSRCQRRELQDFGDRVREDKGKGPAYFANHVISEIGGFTDTRPTKGWVVDSIRNPAEIRAFRDFSQRFFLFGIYAEKERRWNRVKSQYNRDRKRFDDDDERDTGDDSPKYGQRVADCFAESDVVIANDQDFSVPGNEDFRTLAGRLGRYASLVSQPLSRQTPINSDESLMAMAYAASQRSSCRKRKVGAVIVDELENVISSGFNEVPRPERPCEEEYSDCYRDWLCNKFFMSLSQRFPNLKGEEQDLRTMFRGEFKILDYCRALHAEEQAILNLARNGRTMPLAGCKLFTTTYPCRMCANKIVSVGIKTVVYLEPYPDQEAKKILAGSVNDVFFQGVTFKAYFRLYGEER